MGLAASQARFLGLTARKSNVEYQGQQINQQRTALANESANLYNEMMSLDVPTPPASTDFRKTVYTVEDTAQGNYSDCTIANMTKMGGGDNRYKVKLETKQDITVGTLSTPKVNSISRTLQTGSTTDYVYTINLGGSSVVYNPEKTSPFVTENDEEVFKISPNKIYEVDAKVINENISGYSECKSQFKNEDGSEYTGKLYFYQDENKKNCFITEDELTRMTSGAFEGETKNTINPENMSIQQAYTYTKSESYIYEVNATVETSSSNRYTSITIDASDKIPSHLSGKTFSISTTQVDDEEGYENAMNEYKYEQYLYEKALSDINAQTEAVQKKDQQLELRLKQLDTEQNAINTEMEAVKKVIGDNVEKTFKTFNA